MTENPQSARAGVRRSQLAAYREAAFAVVADYFALEIQEIDLPGAGTIELGPERHSYLGHTRLKDTSRVDAQARNLAALAASVALEQVGSQGSPEEDALQREEVFVRPDPSGSDRRWVERFVRERWPSIEAVAQSLIDQTRLEGALAHAIIASAQAR